MGSSQFAKVVRALRDKAAAQTGFRAPGNTALGGITVYVGAQPQGTSDLGDYLVVGYGPDGDAGRWAQSPAAMSTQRPREETGQVRCLASAQSGNLDPLDALDAAFTAIAGLEQALRDDPTVGLVPGVALMVVQVGESGSVTWDTASSGGHRADVEFTVNYMTRI